MVMGLTYDLQGGTQVNLGMVHLPLPHYPDVGYLVWLVVVA